MGEIADALRRSQIKTERERAAKSDLQATSPPAPAHALPTAPRHTLPAVAPPPGLAPQAAAPSDVSDALARINPTHAAIAQEGPEQEACRQVAVRLRGELEARGARSVLVGSALRGEGKTTASCNIALALATISSGGLVALVDLDLRCPSVAATLGIRPRAGIENVLTGDAAVSDARVSIETPRIDVYPVREPQNAAHSLLSRERLRALFDELERHYAIIVVDSPPTLLVPDSRMILERVPLFLPVVRAGTTRVRAYRAMREAIPSDRTLAPVLNEVKQIKQYRTRYAYLPEKTS